MRIRVLVLLVFGLTAVAALFVTQQAGAQKQNSSSFTPVVEEPFEVVRARDKAAKAGVNTAAQRLLEQRYDLRRRVDESVKMTRGKPIPIGPTAKLKDGVTWRLSFPSNSSTRREIARRSAPTECLGLPVLIVTLMDILQPQRTW